MHDAQEVLGVVPVPVRSTTTIVPKVFIIGMFGAEGQVWYGIPEFNLLERNITVPGFSPLYPGVHCTSDGSVCQLVTGEGEINAVATMSALLLSSSSSFSSSSSSANDAVVFDLRKTYFLIAGIAGISPKMGTLGGVTFPLFAVQVGLQFEVDAREVPPDRFRTGYIPQGSHSPDEYPTRIYGTEVFELNGNLREWAVETAKEAKLFDDASSREYRARYSTSPEYAKAVEPPSVVACDTATADQFWSGRLLAEAMENVTRLLSNGSAEYCTTQQEDNGTLAALVRAAVRGVVDFSRVVVMRTASDFDRPYEGQGAVDNLFYGLRGYEAAVRNVGVVGVRIVMGVLRGWEERFGRGVEASNYVGDIFGSLGGEPDFGPGRRVGELMDL
ncbi:purine nucleoside permease [Cytidiella melzeri]|nr:purine nucleoside permease [Cytidiella melzeri]